MKQAKKLECLNETMFQDLKKLTGGGIDPIPPKFTGKLVYMETGAQKAQDPYHLPEGPKNRGI